MEHIKTDELYKQTIKYFDGDIKRIQHFTKVYTFASLIGRLESLNEKEQYILEATAIVHDIGIKNAEMKYGSCEGKLQEKEGPPVARKLLEELGFDKSDTDRICFLVGNHHTYKNIDGDDFQILAEADLIVNFCEEHTDKQSIKTALEKIFKTDAGTEICKTMFKIND